MSTEYWMKKYSDSIDLKETIEFRVYNTQTRIVITIFLTKDKIYQNEYCIPQPISFAEFHWTRLSKKEYEIEKVKWIIEN